MEDQAGHRPVLPEQVIELLAPSDKQLLMDCTLGMAGHARELLHAAPTDARLIGLDADEQSLRMAKKNLAPYRGRVRFFHADFAEIRTVLAEAGEGKPQALLADLGISSTQLDDASRGLSFLREGPLDMRMDTSGETTAADLVNRMPEQELANLIYRYGEERFSRRIARAIVAAREHGSIETTTQLAGIIESSLPSAVRRKRRGVHPATRTFQALRIAVNDELGSLERLLEALPDVLAPGGRAAIISFHSLEDRRVKQAFSNLAGTGQATLLTKKPIRPHEAEIAANPRSRSARLRGIEWHG
jgi:16S rRNA (cytosine1402-N4)-methyltransferase